MFLKPLELIEDGIISSPSAYCFKYNEDTHILKYTIKFTADIDKLCEIIDQWYNDNCDSTDEGYRCVDDINIHANARMEHSVEKLKLLLGGLIEVATGTTHKYYYTLLTDDCALTFFNYLRGEDVDDADDSLSL